MLVPEVEARRALGNRRIRLRVLAPLGSWLGCGRLRVLRLTLREAQSDAGDSEVELTAGYEAYRT